MNEIVGGHESKAERSAECHVPDRKAKRVHAQAEEAEQAKLKNADGTHQRERNIGKQRSH